MKRPTKIRWVRFVIFSNGVIDVVAAIALSFPLLKIPLPGNPTYSDLLTFAAGGWGIAALTFGVGRIWASTKPASYKILVDLGLIEGTLLAAFCIYHVLFRGVTFLQTIVPLSIGSIYGILYLTAWETLQKLDKTD